MKEQMKVMIGYDGSKFAEAAIKDVYRAGLPQNSEILIVSVLDLSAIKPSVSEFDLFSLASRRASMVIDRAKIYHRKEIERVKKDSAQAAERLRARFPEWKIRSEVLYGKPADEILRKASEWHPDLIIVGSHGRSAIGRFFLGSVSQKIAEKAECSVRIVRNNSAKRSAPTSISAGADGLIAAEKLTRALRRRVWSEQTKLSLIIIVDDFSAAHPSTLDPKSTALFLQLAGELRSAGLQVSVEIKGGDPQNVLLTESENRKADAIFVSAAAGDDESFLKGLAAGLITDPDFTVEIVR